MTKKKLKPGGIRSGETFTLDEQFLSYKNADGQVVRISRESINSVAIDAEGWGVSILKIIGHGTEYASIKMPHAWAVKTQLWLVGHLGLNATETLEEKQPAEGLMEPVKKIDEKQPENVEKSAKKCEKSSSTIYRIASTCLIILGMVYVFSVWSVWGVLVGIVSIIAAMVVCPSFSALWLTTTIKPLSREDKIYVVIFCLLLWGNLFLSATASRDEKKAELLFSEALEAIEQGDFGKARELAVEASSLFRSKDNAAVIMTNQIDRSGADDYALEIVVGMTDDEVALLAEGRLDKQFFPIKALNDRFLAILYQELPKGKARREALRAESEARQAKIMEEKLRAQFRAHFSSWDGSHRKLVSAVKNAMHDPRSFEHVETVYWTFLEGTNVVNAPHLVVRMTFRGANAFGGIITRNVKAWIDVDGTIHKWEWF